MTAATTIQAKYDPREDRMLLSVAEGEGKPVRQMWFTRRLWLALLNQVVEMKVAPLDDPKPAAQPQPGRGKAQPLPAPLEAITVTDLRMTVDNSGNVRLLCGTGDGKERTGIAMKKESLADLQRMLEQQADRAGWDPRAGLERLAAAAAAARAMKKAQGGA